MGADGRAPAPGNIRDIFLFVFYVVFGAALVVALKRSEAGNQGLLDAAIFAAGGMLLLVLILVEPYIATSDLPLSGQAVQVASAGADVALLAIALRLLMTPAAESPSLQLLVGAAFAWVASDVVSVWLTSFGEYVPGSSVDIGWLLAFAFSGAAALHPSMASVSASGKARATAVRWPFFVLLATALLAGSAITAHGLLLDKEISSVTTVAITTVLSLLVLARIALLLRTEQRLRRDVDLRNERLLELDRMKDGFVAAVSHELRTPLTSISGFTTTILARWSQLSDEDKLTFLHTVDDQAQRLNRLVDTVLLLSRIQAGGVTGVREALDLRIPARNAAHEIGVEASIEVDGDAAPVVEGDPDQIYQIFVNLLANARRYGAPPVRVTIETAERDVVVRVSDEGVGVPTEFVPHLFEAFTQAPTVQAAEGAGLGLAIVKGLVETSRGDIWYEALQPRGACFVVRLPRLAHAAVGSSG
jgi:signal transduction histidine kinase